MIMNCWYLCLDFFSDLTHVVPVLVVIAVKDGLDCLANTAVLYVSMAQRFYQPVDLLSTHSVDFYYPQQWINSLRLLSP